MLFSAVTLLVYYDSGFVVPDWTALHEPGDWNRIHILDWTGFPSLISSTYLSSVERAMVRSDQSSFPASYGTSTIFPS
jgi:hypothetical protein